MFFVVNVVLKKQKLLLSIKQRKYKVLNEPPILDFINSRFLHKF